MAPHTLPDPPGSHTFVQTVTRNFLKLGVGELIARVIGFLTVIYIARRLGPDTYGIVGFAHAVLLYFAGLADFGIEALGPREVAHQTDRLKRLAVPILAARLFLAAGLTLLLVLVGVFVLPRPDGLVLAFYGFTLFAVGGSARWIHMGLERAGRVAVARTVGEVLRALLILLLVHEAVDVINVPIAQVVGDSLAALLLLLWLRRQGLSLRPVLQWSAIKPIFRRAWPLAANTLLGLAIYNSDLLFLRAFRATEEVGYYLAAFTLITLLGNLGAAYGSSLLPTLTRAGQTPAHQHALYHTAMAHVAAVALPIAVGGFLLAPEIIRFFFGSSYQASAVVLQILIGSIPFLLLRSVLRAALITAGRQDRIMWITLWAALLNIGLNLLVIPQYGMIGAALTTVATEIVRTVFNQYYTRTAGFPLTRFVRYWKSIASSLVMGAFLWILGPTVLWISLPLGAGVYLLSLILSGGIRFERGRIPSLHV